MSTYRKSAAVRMFNPEMETLPREPLRERQLRGIKQLLERVYANSRFYREHLQKAGVTPDDIKSLEDFSARVPFLTKRDLVKDQEENPPYGNRLPIPEKDIRKVHMTSGTSGMGQEVYALTEADVRWGGETFMYNLYPAGLEPGDVSALLWPVATMPGGLIAETSLRMYGLNGLLLQIFDSKFKLNVMKRFSVHHFWATPAYLTRLARLCEEMDIVPRRDLPRLKAILLSTEPFPVEWAERMEEFWGCTIHDIYGSSQFGCCFAYTCEKGVVPDGKRGYYHLMEQDVYLEVLNPETGEPVGYGEEGEPVLTTFLREGGPLIRFRQGDRVTLLPPGTCDCGRTSVVWEAGTIARLDDMIKMKATNVWPQAVDEALFAYPEIDEYNGRVFIDEGGREVVRIILEFRKDVSEVDVKERILGRLPGELKQRTGVTMLVEEVPAGTVERFEYKARRWTDERLKDLKRVKFVERQ